MIKSVAWIKAFWSGDGSVAVGVPGLEGNGRGSLMALS